MPDRVGGWGEMRLSIVRISGCILILDGVGWILACYPLLAHYDATYTWNPSDPTLEGECPCLLLIEGVWIYTGRLTFVKSV